MMSFSFTVRYHHEDQHGLVAEPGDNADGFLLWTPRRPVTLAAMSACDRVQADVRVCVDTAGLVYSVPSTGVQATAEIPEGTDEDALRDICDMTADILVMLNAANAQ